MSRSKHTEAQMIVADASFAGLRVTRVLDLIIAERGLPRAIRCDNSTIKSLSNGSVVSLENHLLLVPAVFCKEIADLGDHVVEAADVGVDVELGGGVGGRGGGGR